MERSFHDFRVETDEDGVCKHVYIDGIEQKGVIACDIRLRPDEIPLVKLQYSCMKIDMTLSKAAIEDTREDTK